MIYTTHMLCWEVGLGGNRCTSVVIVNKLGVAAVEGSNKGSRELDSSSLSDCVLVM